MPFKVFFTYFDLILWLVMRLSLSMPAKESASLSVSSKLIVWFEIVDNIVFNIVFENGSV
jgi:hypothetical protein